MNLYQCNKIIKKIESAKFYCHHESLYVSEKQTTYNLSFGVDFLATCVHPSEFFAFFSRSPENVMLLFLQEGHCVQQLVSNKEDQEDHENDPVETM